MRDYYAESNAARNPQFKRRWRHPEPSEAEKRLAALRKKHGPLKAAAILRQRQRG